MGRGGVIPRRAGCAETCTSGSEGGPGKRAGRKPGTAPRSDPYTYLRCWEGVVFFAFIRDAYSRRIVGWQLAGHMRTTLVLDALRMALHQRGGGADVEPCTTPIAAANPDSTGRRNGCPCGERIGCG